MITQFFAGNYCSLFKAPFVAVEGALGGFLYYGYHFTKQSVCLHLKMQSLTFSFGIVSCNISPHSHSAECDFYFYNKEKQHLRMLIQSQSTKNTLNKFKMYVYLSLVAMVKKK